MTMTGACGYDMVSDRHVGTYRLAGVAVRVESLHPDVHALCRDYRWEGEPGLVVRTFQTDIDFERGRSRDGSPGEAAPSDGYLETLAVYRKVAEAMPALGAVLVHGSCVAVDGSAYLFSASSGTGKSTHARLWRELLGDRVTMVNDDKPIVRLEGGRAVAYGTPWNGKHRLSSNVAVPLRALCLLGRAERNHIERVGAGEAFSKFLRHVYRPLDRSALLATLGVTERIAGCVDVWRLGCDVSIEAARLSFSAMSGTEAP